MKKIKKLTAIFLVLLMILSAVPSAGLGFALKASALSSSGSLSDTVSYTFDATNGHLVISGSGDIPDYSAGFLGEKSPFKDCAEITHIVIEAGVTGIGSAAFYRCTGIGYIKIPNTVKSIGEKAFSGCTGIRDLSIPYGVTSIGNYAFELCTGLIGINIPASVTNLGDGIFENCTSFTSAILPDSITKISAVLFSNSALISLTIPDTVTFIDGGAFSGCTGLTSVTIPGGVTTIFTDAFKNCPNLKNIYTCNVDRIRPMMEPFGTYTYNFIDHKTVNETCTVCGCSTFKIDSNGVLTKYEGKSGNVVIPDGVTSIGGGAFSGNKSIKNVTIPDGVTSIGDNAFYNCSALSGITIPGSVKSISGSAFSYCSSLWDIYSCDIDSIRPLMEPFGTFKYTHINHKWDNGVCTICGRNEFEIDSNGVLTKYNSEEGTVVIPDGVTGIGSRAFEGSGAKDVTIPDGVTSIEESAFANSGVTSVTVPDSVTSIGNSAFSGCASLTTVTIPDGITKIGDNMFNSCRNLKNVIIPDSVTDIGDNAFAYCYALADVTIPDSVTSIGEGAFRSSGLTSITINNNMSIGTDAFINSGLVSVTFLDGITKISDNMFSGCASLTTVTIPDSVTSIGESTFSGCSSLAGITIPNSVTSIGENTFSNCLSLTDITIPDSVTSIGNGAFSGSGLVSIILPDSITTISDNMFEKCLSLTTVIIPDSVTEIGNYAFNKCSELTNLTISYGVLRVGDYAFNGCEGLQSLILPDSILTIGEYAFYFCESLESIHLPNNVEEIGDYAFSGCTALESIAIPYGTWIIGYCAFYYCTSLKSITYPNDVSDLGRGVFSNCPLSKIYCCEEAHTDGILKTLSKKVYNDEKHYTNLERIQIDHNYVHGECTICGKVCEHNYVDGICPLCGAEEVIIDSKGVLIRYNGTNENFVIPDGVTAIAPNAFWYNDNIKTLTIPDSVTSIGKDAFSFSIGTINFDFCRDISELIKDSGIRSNVVLNRAEHSFTDGVCTVCGVKEFEIDSDGVLTKYNGQSANVVIPDGVTAIGANAFSDNKIIKNVTIPDSVTSIGECVFKNCAELTSVTLPDSITSLGAQAFFYCTGLEEITIPGGIKIIGNLVFTGCKSLSTVYTCNIEKTEPLMRKYGTYNYVLIDHNVVGGVCKSCGYCEFEIDSNGVLINYYGVFPDVVIPDGVTAIGENAFTDAPWISSVVIPDGVISIENNAFEGCEFIESITIPASVTSIGSNAFSGCVYRNSITVDPDNTVFDSRNNCNAIIETATNTLICGCASTVIPDSVTAIGDYAFCNCESPARIAIPLSVTSVGTDAFANTGLEVIEFCTCGDVSELMENSGADNAYFLRRNHNFVEGVCTVCGFKCYHRFDEMEGDGICLECGCTCKHEYVDYVCIICGYREFEVNSNGVLTKYIGKGGKVVIPDGITAIGDNAFTDNTNLTEIVIPDSVTSIGNDAFNGCENLTDAYFLGTEARWNAVTIGSNNDPLINAGVKCTIVSAEPFTDEADFETLETENGAKIISGFNPGDTTAALDKYIAEGWDVSIKTADNSDRIGTGSVVTLTSLRGDTMEYTVVIYGDADGDAWYDAPDSLVVNCLVNGLLSRAQVGEAVWYAADCNHDGVINADDVALLEQAGLLLAEIDQTKSGSSLTEDSVFVEYLNLISQKMTTKEAPVEEPTAEEPADEPVVTKTLIQKIIDFIIYLFNLITSYISKVF